MGSWESKTNVSAELVPFLTDVTATWQGSFTCKVLDHVLKDGALMESALPKGTFDTVT